MDTRKDMQNKRQLSIIDETDYFSDEGHSQVHDREKVEVSNSKVAMQLDFCHISMSSKGGFNGTGSCGGDYDTTCMGTSCADLQSNVMNDTNRHRQDQLVGESIPLTSAVNEESSSQPHDVQNVASHEIRTFDVNIFNGCALVDKAIDCIQSRTFSRFASDVKRNNVVYNSSITHEYFKPTTNGDNSLHAKNGLEMKDKIGSVDSFKDVQASNMDSIHEMFQVLIKCIEGTQNEKQNCYTTAGAEETCKSSPLFYLMEEKVEKPPQGVGNIISSFKEKFSQPNAKRIPIRQKSRRSLALEKVVETPDLTTETKSVLPGKDCRRSLEKDMSTLNCNMIQSDDKVYSKESAGVNRGSDDTEAGEEEDISRTYNVVTVIIENDIRGDQNEYENCANYDNTRNPNSVKSETESLSKDVDCCVTNSGECSCFKCESFPINVIPEIKEHQSTSIGIIEIPETSPTLDSHVEKEESTPKGDRLQIPIFKRDGQKPYDDDEEINFWVEPESKNGVIDKKKSFSETKSKVNLLTVPKDMPDAVQSLTPLPIQQNQDQMQQSNVSKAQQSTPSSQILSSPSCPTQPGKTITFLNSNGSIARRPMLRHVSQPNMNAHKLAKTPGTVNQTENTPNPESVESKFQTKDLNSDLAKLKATAERLKLVTRRPSYLEWLEERKKNRTPLDILGIRPAMASNGKIAFTSEDSKLERIKGKCKSFGLSNSSPARRCLFSHHPRFDAGTEKVSSRRSICSSSESSDGCGSSSSSDTEIDEDDDNVFPECDRKGVHVTDVIDGAAVQDYLSKQVSLDKTTNPGFQMPTMWKFYVDRDRLTPARKQRIDKSLDWLRNELKCMRSQDQALAKQLLSLRHEMHQLRLSWSCQEHRDLLDEVQCDLEDIKEFSKVLDLPSTVYLDTPLKNVGVTKLNISARRFSTC